MAKINLMTKQLAELIAAGEVVERPASVVKELVENSLDAGATEITVEIDRGGILLIRVTDNGCGISRDDVKTAFLRHATSKISAQEDLDSIATLGFRGEALAAISAVSRIEMITRTENETAGTHYTSEGGENEQLDDIGCAVGTSIGVKDIFYNTPARMKFLKKDISEANAVCGVVDKIALSHPEVSFKVIRDGKVTLNTPGDNKLNSAIYTVLGRDFSGSLVPVEYELGGIRVVGYTSKPTACRPNRNMQYFYINGRFVKSRTIMAAVEQAYRNSSMVGKFPACVLHLSIPYGTVDVNVHPAKTEVRFSDEKRIFDAVYYSIKNVISGAQSPAPRQMNFEKTPNPPQAVIKQFFESTTAADFNKATAEKPTYNTKPTKSSVAERIPSERISPDELEKKVRFADSGINLYSAGGRPVNLDIAVEDDPPAEIADVKVQASEPAEENQRDEKTPTQSDVRVPLRVIGEVFSTYILIEQGDEFILLDKHAAHERIIFNELKHNESPEQQLLLEPVSVDLPREEYDAVVSNLAILQKTGYEVDDFGGSVIVRAVPVWLAGENISMLISEAAQGFIEHKRDAVGDRMTWLYESVACRSAVKAGNKLGLNELTALAERVLYNDDVLYCPHGRPVTIRMTKKDLEKQFGRIQG